VLGILSELGYDVEWQIYNSKSYGVAQNRERLYIKGYFRAKCGREILLKRRNRTEIGNSRRTKSVGNNELKPVEFERQVRKRVHSTNYDELCDFLRKHKKVAKVTMVEISEKLGVPKSEVDHWFRKDSYFAPPTPEVWDGLKSILNIKDDKYDAFITEFEYLDGVYEKDKRAYGTDGLGATLTCNGESLVVENDTDIKVVGNTSATNHGGENVYDVMGISSTLTASNYKHPLSIMENENPKIVKLNDKSQGQSVYDVNGLSCTIVANGGGHGGKTGLYLEDGGNKTIKLKTNTTKGYDEVTAGDGVRLCHPSSTKARGRSQKGQTGALSTSSDWGTVTKDFRIRRLTPRECERLQAFPDDWTKYGKDGEEISDTQRYKCLGNAVTTTVITHIIDNEFFGEDDVGDDC
jgi:site-specific DNA-cytosine methylase